MPLYEYECGACGLRFEIIQKFSDPPASVCTKCGKGPVNKLLSAPAFQFKGTGWYITDYARKGDSAFNPPSSAAPGSTGKTGSSDKSESSGSSGSSEKSGSSDTSGSSEKSGSSDSSSSSSSSGDSKPSKPADSK